MSEKIETVYYVEFIPGSNHDMSLANHDIALTNEDMVCWHQARVPGPIL